MDPTVQLRHSFYLLLTAVAVGICVAKIVGAEAVIEPSRYKPPAGGYGADWPAEAKSERAWPSERPEPAPWFSSNDKSRWATVRALVEQGTYVIGRRENFRDKTGPFHDSGVIVNRQGKLDSLDVVMNPETGEFYSSKPPLFPTLLAGGYWVLHRGFGLSLNADRWPVVILTLLVVNALPFVAYLILLGRLIERFGTTDFGKLFAFTVAAVGTFLTTFAVTLNNHSPAAYGVVFALYPLMTRDQPSAGAMFLSGLWTGLTVTFELPAAALAGAICVVLVMARPGPTIRYFLPGLVLPIIALLACNYAALGQLRPAYTEFGGPWYEYGGSHWAKLKEPVRPRGIDFNQEPAAVYGFHLLLGHHGWFSLTPAWLVGLLGIAVTARRWGPEVKELFARQPGPVFTLPAVTALTAGLALVLTGFFLTQTKSYNYGGFTSGLRWFFWLTPLWVLAALAGADRLGRSTVGRTMAAVALGASVLSVFYPAWNPWRHPWAYQLCEWTGWVRY